MGSISWLASWYKLGRKAQEMGETVVKLKGKIDFDHISFSPRLQSHFENKDYLRSVTREKFVDEIMEELGDTNIRTIGLHGMPGVGKTTLVKEIARKALKEYPRLFNDLVIVTISQTPDLENIQQRIAERLDLELKKKMISERALEIRHRLKDENKFLIVVDDVWSELKLEDVGIAFENDQKGCKILITSRFV
ncbi:probable disease resistance protein At1g61310 [Ziziphus jujuba]|uniref:Probable disease resistance protein At1g61310 n=1 Tax=Ziziphus jujuba TaxID=326968 RepID=A0ABM3ID66_ZIZJJ|nr:probable disease resistance protein At1g61310 [Ziziphus jujuba]